MGHQDYLALWTLAMLPHQHATCSAFINFYRWFQVLNSRGWLDRGARCTTSWLPGSTGPTGRQILWPGMAGMDWDEKQNLVYPRPSPVKNRPELSPPPAHFRVFCVRFFQGCNPADPMVGLARDSPVKRDEPKNSGHHGHHRSIWPGSWPTLGNLTSGTRSYGLPWLPSID